MNTRPCFTCGIQVPQGVPACPACGSVLGDAGDPLAALARDLALELGEAFELREQIGRGGYAVVFKVHDRTLNRLVAVKALLPELAAVPDIRLRFSREVETASRLGHPNIVPIYFVGAGERLSWYAMPLIEGESLASRLGREGTLSVPVALGIARDVAAALDFAHGAGVVHRDVKPDNILLEFNTGRALLMDFGIAKAVEHESGLTGTGVVIGTPHYVSPEQAMGDKSIDQRTDVYSLGVVLYEMLSGDPPFAGSNAHQIFSGHLSRNPPALTSKVSAVTARMETVLFRALAKEPADRFNTAGGLVQELEDAFGRRSLRVSGAQALDKMNLNDVRLFRTLEMHVASADHLEAAVQSVPDLLEALPRIEEGIRAAAMEREVRGLIKGYRTLVQYLDGKSPGLAGPVQTVMERLAKEVDVVEALVQAWRGGGEQVQATVERVLSLVIGSAGGRVVALGRRDKDASTLLLADRVGALDDAAVSALVDDPNSAVSLALSEALRESARPRPALERWLLALFGHRRPEVRRAAVSVAASRGGSLAEHIGTRAYRDPDGTVRLAGLRALGRSGSAAALALLTRVLDSDSGLSERVEAARAVGDLRLRDGVPVLSRTFDRRKRFRRERGPVQLAAVEALGSLPFEYSGDVLRGLVNDPDPDVSRVAGAAVKLAGANADKS